MSVFEYSRYHGPVFYSGEKVTPEMVVEAYKASGWKPMFGCYKFNRGKDTCGCAIGVLNHKSGGAPWVIARETLGSTTGDRAAFERGFDGDPIEYFSTEVGGDSEEAYAQGVAAREAVIAAFGEILPLPEDD